MPETGAIVTGASQGIGRATAIRLAKDFRHVRTPIGRCALASASMRPRRTILSTRSPARLDRTYALQSFTSFTVTSLRRDLYPQESAHAGRTQKGRE
jgi:NAD(P)-dependent dehydrogenase (short-subunit alcohol dehydrogenase family)